MRDVLKSVIDRDDGRCRGTVLIVISVECGRTDGRGEQPLAVPRRARPCASHHHDHVTGHMDFFLHHRALRLILRTHPVLGRSYGSAKVQTTGYPLNRSQAPGPWPVALTHAQPTLLPLVVASNNSRARLAKNPGTHPLSPIQNLVKFLTCGPRAKSSLSPPTNLIGP